MSTTITIYFSESPFPLVLLVRKSNRLDQLVNSRKKENGKTALNLQPSKRIARQPRTHNLRMKIVEAE